MTHEPNHPLSDTNEISKADHQEILRQLHKQSRSFVAPIYWGTDERDANSVLHNGSCFVVEIDGFLFGITAHHVIAKYKTDRDTHAHIHLRIRNLDILNWDDRQIDGDSSLDLVTFQVESKEVAEMDIRPFRLASENWPPKPPKIGGGVFLTGYAGEDRTVVNRATLDFLQLSNAGVLTSLGPQELEVQFRMQDLQPVIGDTEIPPITKVLGGFSGAPLLTVLESPAKLFELGGIIQKQIPAKDDSDVATFISRRPDCLRTDGTLITSIAS